MITVTIENGSIAIHGLSSGVHLYHIEDAEDLELQLSVAIRIFRDLEKEEKEKKQKESKGD